LAVLVLVILRLVEKLVGQQTHIAEIVANSERYDLF
jgi:hypothetical protein